MKFILLAPLLFLRLIYQSIYLALSQIWANKTRSVLTTIGIVIGVASVIGVIAALTGLKAKVLSQVETLGSNTIIINVKRPDTGPQSNLPWWNFRFKARELEGITENCPSVAYSTLVAYAGQHTIKYGEKAVQNANVTGYEPAWHEIENRAFVIGRKLSIVDEGRAVCLIEPELRDKLGLNKDCVGETIRIGYRNFRVVEVIEKQNSLNFGGGGQERYEIIIPFRMVAKFNNQPWISALAAGRSTELTDEAVAEIKFYLRRMRSIQPGEQDTFSVDSLESLVEGFNNIALAVTLVAGGIVGISLLVGGVGIMNIMLVSISERTKEIGLRKAVGAKRSAILTQFLVEAIILCFVGGMVGVAIGKMLTLLISKINPMLDMTQIPPWAIVLSFAFAGTVGIVFGMFPAIKASRLDPIEALRHE